LSVIISKFYVKSDTDSVILLQGTLQYGTTREDKETAQKLAQRASAFEFVSVHSSIKSFSGDHYFLLDTNNVGIALEGVAASSLVLKA